MNHLDVSFRKLHRNRPRRYYKIIFRLLKLPILSFVERFRYVFLENWSEIKYIQLLHGLNDLSRNQLLIVFKQSPLYRVAYTDTLETARIATTLH